MPQLVNYCHNWSNSGPVLLSNNLTNITPHGLEIYVFTPCCVTINILWFEILLLFFLYIIHIHKLYKYTLNMHYVTISTISTYCFDGSDREWKINKSVFRAHLFWSTIKARMWHFQSFQVMAASNLHYCLHPTDA